MEQRTGGNSQENVFGWTTKCTDLFFQSSMLGSMRCYLFIQLHSDYSCPHLTYHTQVDFFIPATQHSNLSNAWQRAPASGFRPKNEQRVAVSNPMESVLPDQLSYETLFTFPVFRTVGRERIPQEYVPTKILHQTYEPNATLAVLNLMSLVKMKPCHYYKP